MIIIQNIKAFYYQSFHDLKDDVENCNYSDESKYWHKNGRLHRDLDLPAVIESDGTKYWYKNGKSHRENDLPAAIYQNGIKCWYKNGKLIKRS